MRVSRRAVRTIAELGTLSRVVWLLLIDNPAYLGVQAARRIPAPLRRAFASVQPPSFLPATLRAMIYTMADRRREAQRVLEQAPSSLFANELRGLHGLPLPESATPTQRARQMWENGDLMGALEVAPRGTLRATLESHERTLRPGSRLRVPRVGQRHSPRGSNEALRVMFQLTNSLPWTQSGYTLRSHRILTALRGCGVKVDAMTRIGYPLDIGSIGAQTTDIIDGVAYHRFMPRRLPRYLDARYFKQAEALARFAGRMGADVIHTTTPYSNALIAEAAARALGIPWVYEARGEMESTWLASRPEWAREAAARSRRYELMRLKEIEMAQRADAVIVLSSVQRESFIARGLPPEKITVIRNAVESASLGRTLTKHEARAQLGLDPGAWLIGSVSAIVDYEGLETLVQAIGFLRDDGIRVNAAIVGDGVALPDLRDLAQELSLEDRIVFPGRVSPDEARIWYQALDVMVIPRRDTEVTRAVTPMKGLQAMGFGIPQIVSDLPALVEVAAAEGQGLAVAPDEPRALADAVEYLIRDTTALEAYGSAARSAAPRHTWDVRVQELCKVYRDVTASPPLKETSE